MKIELLKLVIRNFKGIVLLKVTFDKETFIYGANGSGKTSIADAFFWLLFGKNSADEKDFNVKNTVNTDLNELDHVVEGTMLINGEETVLRHAYREKWVKKKGSEIKSYTGNENDYFWNEVPCQLKEWNARIEKILSADTFKKITHPGYFNTIPWQKRRETLIEMGGHISDAEIAGADSGLLKLLANMGKKTVKDYRSELSARKSKLKDEQKHLPARIDELKNTLPGEEPNFDAIQAQIKGATDNLNEIDLQLSSKTQAQKKWQDDQSAVLREIHLLKRKQADLSNKLRIELGNQDLAASSDIDASKQRIASLSASLQQLDKDKIDAEARIATYVKQREALLAEFKKINESQFEYPPFVFDAANNTCPHCKQLLPEEDINTRRETMKANHEVEEERQQTAFNNNKLRQLEDNKAAGFKIKTSRESVEDSLRQIEACITNKKADLASEQAKLSSLEISYTQPAPLEERLADVLKNNKEALSLQAALEAQQALVKEEPADEDNTALKTRKTELGGLISDLTKQLGQKDTIINTKVRINKLQEDEKNLAQQIATVEQEEDLLYRFEKKRMEVVNERVNSLFQYVKFKLFNTNINGGEEACCETMLDGVPYSDLNTAGKIKAGIDIINALSAHYNVYAPIFLDNRESVTAIPATESQVIDLIVNEEEQKLLIISGTDAMDCKQKYQDILTQRRASKALVEA